MRISKINNYHNKTNKTNVVSDSDALKFSKMWDHNNSSVYVQKTNLVLDPSPWPFSTAFSVYILVIGMVASFHLYSDANIFLILGFFLFLSVFSL